MMRTLIVTTTSATILFSSAGFTHESRQRTASIPDFSGIWAHPSGPGFEPPASGPGPVVFAIGRGSPFVGDYTNPILKPQAAEVVKKHGEIELSGMAHPTPSTHCWPSGVQAVDPACRMGIRDIFEAVEDPVAVLLGLFLRIK